MPIEYYVGGQYEQMVYGFIINLVGVKRNEGIFVGGEVLNLNC